MTDEIPTMTMANTKREMLEVYEEMKSLLKAKEREALDAEREKERYRKEAAAAIAQTEQAQDPLERISNLQASLAHDLNALAEQYDQATQEFKRLSEAVEEKQAELERVFGVETAAVDLAALIEAQKQKRQQFEAEIAADRAAWAKEREEHEQQLEAERAALERKRTWEAEEYEYALSRERQQRRNELQDELAALESEIETKRKTAEAEIEAKAREMETRERELAERERAVAEREGRIDELEERVRGIAGEVEAAVAKAVAETTERLRAEFASREALLIKESEGQRNVLESRIEGLQLLVDRQSKQIEALTAQQEQAYQKVQEIASKAIEGARPTIVRPTMPTSSAGDAERREQ